MFKYHQYCPVARACEILADRWTPLIVRELLFGSRHFNELQRGLPGISRSLLVARLRHLEDSGVIERHTGRAAECLGVHAHQSGKRSVGRDHALRHVGNQMGLRRSKSR